LHARRNPQERAAGVLPVKDAQQVLLAGHQRAGHPHNGTVERGLDVRRIDQELQVRLRGIRAEPDLGRIVIVNEEFICPGGGRREESIEPRAIIVAGKCHC